MAPRTNHLKIKIKSLAAEAGFIRAEERRAARWQTWARKHGDEEAWAAAHAQKLSLADHRRGIVRKAARENLLAYAWLRGRRCPEQRVKREPHWWTVAKLVKRFGGETTVPELTAWAAEARDQAASCSSRPAA